LCKNHRKTTNDFDLRHYDYGNEYDLCPNCYQWRIDAADKVITVHSAHVGGHRLKQKMEYLETRYPHKDMDSAMWEMRYNAHLRGANAVLDFYCIPHEASSGNYKYKTWTAKGNLALVEPNK